MKTATAPLFSIVLLGLLSTGATSAPRVYNLAADWSDTSNPNGAWSYNAGDTPITNHLDSIFTHAWSAGQPGWAMAAEGNGHVPAWFKMAVTEEFVDLPIGTVAVHGSDPDPSNTTSFTQEPTNVTWTSPITGTIDISGGAWITQALGRSMAWTLTLNGVILDSGVLNDTDPYDSSNPDAFSVSGVAVAIGDVVKWETVQAVEPHPQSVAIDLTITETSEPTRQLRITSIAHEPSTQLITLIWEPAIVTGIIERSDNLKDWKPFVVGLSGTTWTGSIPGNPEAIFLRVRGDLP